MPFLCFHSFTILPVGFAIDRLEGDGIKTDSWLATPLGEALAGTASAIVCRVLCIAIAGGVVGYLT
ncbi:MAG: hypothetical protein KF746_11130 [Chitinophagaceae bacterium]|nr:hypothetical protein [Chitinophagaceae bacterium]